jgi:hypothetical protein
MRAACPKTTGTARYVEFNNRPLVESKVDIERLRPAPRQRLTAVILNSRNPDGEWEECRDEYDFVSDLGEVLKEGTTRECCCGATVRKIIFTVQNRYTKKTLDLGCCCALEFEHNANFITMSGKE